MWMDVRLLHLNKPVSQSVITLANSEISAFLCPPHDGGRRQLPHCHTTKAPNQLWNGIMELSN